MTVALVLSTFVVFIVIDYLMNRKKAPVAVAAAAVPAMVAPLGRNVQGIPIPEGLRYHPGHTWVARERKNVIRVGADAFAAQIAGNVESIELPKPGHWVRQGQKAIGLVRGTQKAEMVCPVEGEVVEINPEVVKNPALLKEDPYGKGWLMTVFAPDEEGPSRNLLPESLLRPWMREALDRFFALQPQVAGATAAEAGPLADDPAAKITGLEWREAVRPFFLS